MNLDELEKLTGAVDSLINQESFQKTIERLGDEINDSPEAFVWSVIDLNSIEREPPEQIRSCWVFVLKRDMPSGCHYHPNSIQHMVMIKGQGMSKVAGISRKLVLFRSPAAALEDKWFVIGKSVPHEFFPQHEDMIVVSFHTCEADELEEVDCETGHKRLYEG